MPKRRILDEKKHSPVMSSTMGVDGEDSGVGIMFRFAAAMGVDVGVLDVGADAEVDGVVEGIVEGIVEAG